jgi:hypothetical protein
MVSRARFHALHCRTDPKFMKHSREYLLAAIDGLRSKEKWNVLTIGDFPMKEQSASTVKYKRFKLNLEEDSDGADYAELLQLKKLRKLMKPTTTTEQRHQRERRWRWIIWEMILIG